MDILDHKNFDYLTLLVKKKDVENIIKYYKSFGWQIYEKKEDEKYDDTLIITFCRAHKLKNKDRLQLLQVRLESKLNELGKCEKYKYSKSTIFGLTAGIGLLLLLSLGIFLMAEQNTIFSRFGGIIITIISSVLLVLMLIKIDQLKKSDNEKYIEQIKSINTEISSICDMSKKLVEVEKNEFKENHES